jgi:integrase
MAAAQKVTLSDLRVKNYKPAPAGKRLFIWDGGQPHLALRITDKGHKSWLVIKRRPGEKQPLFHVLGSYPVLKLADARKAAQKAVGLILDGIDPSAAKVERIRAVERQQAETFGLAAEAFIAAEESRASLRTSHETVAFLRREFLGQQRKGSSWVDGKDPVWRDRPLLEISRRDVVDRLDEIRQRTGSAHAARHSLAAVRKFFNWCIDREKFGVTTSPCVRIRNTTIGINGSKDLRRTRVLTDMELRDVWQEVEALGVYGCVVRLLMLTGQRLGDIAQAKWSEIDLAAGVLVVPAERYKTNTAQHVPLSPRALAILRDLSRTEGFIFSPTGGQRPITTGSRLKQLLDEAIAARRQREGRAAMPPWVLHDLRRTVRTRLVSDLGVEQYIAERVIGHALTGLDRVYDQGSHAAAKADALLRWEARLVGIVEPEATHPPAVTELSSVRRRRSGKAA